MAEKRVTSVPQVHILKVDPVLVALWADAEPLVPGEALVAAPIFEINCKLVLFVVVAICQGPK